MPTEEKIRKVEELSEKFSQNSVMVATDYRGLSVSEISQLRHQLREVNAEYRVVKNTLAYLAAKKAGKPALTSIIKGPTALALSREDALKVIKPLVNFQRTSKTTLSIRGGLLDGKVLSADDIVAISTMPSKEVLVAKLMGTLQTPLYSLVNTLSANTQKLVIVLRSRFNQLEEADKTSSD